jgi:hypothetical protein
MIAPLPVDPTAPRLRRGLLWLGALSVVGIGVELAVERHWTQPVQFVAWAALVVAAVAIVLLMGTPSAGRVRVARVLAVVVMLSAVLGIWEHIAENYDSGELDRNYADTWDSLPTGTRWWLAISKTVGPSPPLAPAALAEAGLCVVLASLGHPAFRPTEAAPSDRDDRPTLPA